VTNAQIPIFSVDDIAPHLDLSQLVEPVSDAFCAITQGNTRMGIDVLHPTECSDIHIKSAMLQGSDIFTVKTAGWSATNEANGLPASSGLITVFDAQSCHPLAILQDNHLISDLRTAAAGAVAARTLANPEIPTLGVLGAGEQAFLQVLALCQVRTPDNVKVWNRSPEKARLLVERLNSARPDLNVEIIDDRRTLIEDADLLIIATSSKQPLVEAEWLKPGVHITSVGADDATKCELGIGSLQRADLIAVDSLNACQAYGNIYRAVKHGFRLNEDTLCELGSILNGTAAGRTSPDQITIASLVGVGAQDLAAVALLREPLGF